MLTNVLTMVVLLALFALFLMLAIRSWRSHRPLARYLGGVLTSLLSLALLVVTAVVSFGFYKMNFAPHSYKTADIKAQASPEAIARAQKVASLCADCHSSSGALPLDGSKDNFIAGGPPMGVIYAPNLTPGGPLKDWTDGEIIRAIREGVDKNGRPLLIMPSQAFRYMSDEDVQAMVAYLRSQPAVDRKLPERNLNALAAAFLGAGMFPTSAQTPVISPIPKPALGTIENGKYITYAYGCHDCHGPNLGGMSGGGFGPAAPAIAGVVSNWKEEDLVKVFHEGVDPTGHKLSDEMPWKKYGEIFTDQELKDLYSYLSSLPLQTASTK